MGIFDAFIPGTSANTDVRYALGTKNRPGETGGRFALAGAAVPVAGAAKATKAAATAGWRGTAQGIGRFGSRVAGNKNVQRGLGLGAVGVGGTVLGRGFGDLGEGLGRGTGSFLEQAGTGAGIGGGNLAAGVGTGLGQGLGDLGTGFGQGFQGAAEGTSEGILSAILPLALIGLGFILFNKAR